MFKKLLLSLALVFIVGSLHAAELFRIEEQQTIPFFLGWDYTYHIGSLEVPFTGVQWSPNETVKTATFPDDFIIGLMENTPISSYVSINGISPSNAPGISYPDTTGMMIDSTTTTIKQVWLGGSNAGFLVTTQVMGSYIGSGTSVPEPCLLALLIPITLLFQRKR